MDRPTRQRVLSSFRQRLFRVLFVKSLIVFTAVFFFLWGGAVLAMRVAGLDDWRFFSLGFLVLPLLPAYAWLATRNRVPGERRLASILDRDNRSGGLLMTSFETELGDWSERIETLEIPKVRWMPQRTLSLVAVAMVFAVAALLFPLSVVSGSNPHRLNVDDQVKRLTTQLDVMEEEKLLDVEEVESRKLDLQKIQKEADGLGPVKTFDALDHIADRMNQKAQETVEDAQKTTEQMAEAMALSQEVKEIHNKLDDTRAKSLMDGLARSLEEMFAANEKMADDMKKTLAEQAEKKKKEGGDQDGKDDEKGENGDASEKEKNDALIESLKKMMEEKNMEGLTPDMIDQLCEAMQKCQGDCERMCENLQNAGFPIDQEMLEKLAESKNVEKAEAERMLSELWANCDGCDGEPGDCEGDEDEFSPRFSQKQDWRTDPNTPPGKKRFEKEPDEEGAEFKARFLPPADLEAFKNSLKIGASTSAPEFDPAGTKGDHGGAIRETGGGTGNAHSRTIYPQHRGAVGRYFEK